MTQLHIRLGYREWRLHNDNSSLWLILSRQWHRPLRMKQCHTLKDMVGLRLKMGAAANDAEYGSTVPNLFDAGRYKKTLP